MRRLGFMFVSYVVFLSLLISRGATADSIQPGVTVQSLASGSLAELPSAPALVGLARVTYDPGVTEQIGIGPYGDLLYVESGGLTIRTDGTATVTRSGEEPATQEEQHGSGVEFAVGAGDSAVLPGGFPIELRNAGQDKAVVLVGFVGIVEGDPSGRPADPAGVVQQLLGLGMTTAVPNAPGLLSLDRIALAAGGAMPIGGNVPTLTLVAVESGALTLSAGAPLTIFRDAGPPEEVAAGDDVLMGQGDSVFLPIDASAGLRVTGEETASVMSLTVASPN